MEDQNEKLVVNELLFYLQNKIRVTPKDAIVESCVKFYTIDEITTAISVFESALKICLSKRNKLDDLQNKLINDLYDKIWSLDAANTQIPRFAALDLSQIPRERDDSDSLASSEQLLASVHSLKSVVHFLRDNMVTRDFLEKTLASRLTTSSNKTNARRSHPTQIGSFFKNLKTIPNPPK